MGFRKQITISALALLMALYAGMGHAQVISGGGSGGSFNGGTINKGFTNNGGTAQVGSTVISGIGQPSAPTVTPNTTGSTTATYYCDALDLNGLTNLAGGTGNTIPSAGTTITNGAATPNTTIKCGGQTGAMGYVVTKGATGGATSFLGSCLTLGSGNACSVTDTGQALTTYTANGADETDLINAGGLYVGSVNNSPIVPGISVSTVGDVSIDGSGGHRIYLNAHNGGSVFFGINLAASIDNNGLIQPGTYHVASLPACSSGSRAGQAAIDDNDAACAMNAAPAHSTCTVGTNCFTCQVQCAESGSTTYSWLIY